MVMDVMGNQLTVGSTAIGGAVVSQQITAKKVRLFFHGGAKSNSDNNSFYNAAVNVRKDYAGDIDAEFYKIESAEDIVKKIAKQKDNSIQSIDFFSHGGVSALYIKYSTIFDKNVMNNSLYITDAVEQEHTTFFENSADLSEINYNKFTDSAKIEVHGCKAGSIEPEINGGKNFCSEFSMHLFKAGKIKSVVIGHVTNSSPDGHKTLKGDDYRYGGRRVYHNGKELFFTKQEGRISVSEINQNLEGKK